VTTPVEGVDADHPTRHRVAGRRACAGCGATYGSPEWQALPLSGTLASEAVQMHLSVPVLWRVEQRRCPCGNVLSGLVRVGYAA
jgi:hypothetical protein